MAITDEFYRGTDWEGASTPYINRNVAGDDLWPHGDGGEGEKAALADGLHPVLAIGDDGSDNRDVQAVGVMVTYNPDIDRAVMNVAQGFVVRQYVANVLTYDQGSPATFAGVLAIGEPVYVDDSADLAAGVTLTLSPANDAGDDNPLAGWLWYDQAEDQDVGIGGDNAAAWPKVASEGELMYVKVNVLMRGAA